MVEGGRQLAQNLTEQIDRLREGLRRLKNQDYDSGYTAESYAEAILSADEPNGESTIDG